MGDASPIVCRSDGLWSGSIVDCQIVECPAALPPSSAVEVSISSKYGGDLVWKCAPGYVKLAGDERRSCQATGLWSGQALSCIGKGLI